MDGERSGPSRTAVPRIKDAAGVTRASVRRDAKGVGGFYEAIMAMMIVTAGVVLLTASFALLSADRGQDGQGAEEKCREVMTGLLADPSLARSERLLDERILSRFDGGAMMSNWTGGMKVLLTFADGRTMPLYDSGGEVGPERACLSEPVNIHCHQADVKAALLTVWVWP